MAHSCDCWQETSVSSAHGPLNRAANISSRHDSWLPPEQMTQEKKSKLKATMSFMAYSLKSLLLWQCLSTLKGRRNCVCVRERERKNERERERERMRERENTIWHLFRSFLLGQFLAFNSINWFLLSTSYVPYTLLNTWNSLSHLILNGTLRDSVVHSHRAGL